MNKNLSLSMILLLLTSGPVFAAGVDAFQGTWVKPDESTITADAAGDSIKRGREILSNTYKMIGGGSQWNPPVSGNRLSCTSCHLDGGTAAFASPWSVVALKYAPPGVYSSRSHDRRTMEVRVNDCMQRSMNGRILPDASQEMKDIKAYWTWLATGIKVAKHSDVKGTGFLPMTDMPIAASPDRGKIVYDAKCEACHQANGDGVWDEDAQRAVYPAVFGPNSFNDGAGIYRLRSGAGFVYGNMPYGRADASLAAAVPPDYSTLISEQEAWDVLAYIISQPRPAWRDKLKDWGFLQGQKPDFIPDWINKPVDTGYAVYYLRKDYATADLCKNPILDDNTNPSLYPADQYKYGPWGPMLTVQKNMIARYKVSGCPPPAIAP